MRDYERYALLQEEHRRKKKKKRKNRNFMFFAFFLLLIICIVTIVSTTVFFNIENIAVEGNSIYSDEQIINTSGIASGKNLFSIDTRKIEEKLTRELPYIKSARIERHLPSTVLISVEMDKPHYALPVGGGYILLSKESKVLEAANALPEGIPSVKGLDIKNCTTGFAVEYNNPEILTTALEIIDAVEGSRLKGKIVEIDLASEFNIKLKYTDRFDIIIGDSFELSRKIAFAEAVIDRLFSNDRGTISVMGEKASFLPYSEQGDND